MPDTPRYLVRAAELQAQPEFLFHHPLNPRSAIAFRQQDGKTLSELTGLTRTGVHLCRILPGKEGFAYHRHYREEEWVFVLSGRGIAEIGDEEFEIGPGDFLGYPPGSVAHHLKNPHAEDLVCLMGGERCSVEIADFPRDGKRMLRDGQKEQLVNVADLQPMFPAGGDAADPQPG